MNYVFWLDLKEYRVSLCQLDKGDFEVTVGDRAHRVLVESPRADELLLNIDGQVRNVVVTSNDLAHSVLLNGRRFAIEKRSSQSVPREPKASRRRRDVKSSMPGRVVAVLAAEGDSVREGQAVLVVEAMKMQNEMKAPAAGQVVRIGFKAGEYVEAGATLFVIE